MWEDRLCLPLSTATLHFDFTLLIAEPLDIDTTLRCLISYHLDSNH